LKLQKRGWKEIVEVEFKKKDYSNYRNMRQLNRNERERAKRVDKTIICSKKVITKKKIKNKTIKVFTWLFYNILYDILNMLF